MSQESMHNYVAQLALFLGQTFKRNRMIYDTDNVHMAVKFVLKAEGGVSTELVMGMVNAAHASGVVSFQDHRGMCYILPGNAPPKGEPIDAAYGGPWGARQETPLHIKERMVKTDTTVHFQYENGHRVWRA